MEKRRKILKNSVQCLKCADIIESTYTHNYVTCSCGNVSVDGGKDYLKRCFKVADSWIDLSEYEPVKEEDSNAETLQNVR